MKKYSLFILLYLVTAFQVNGQYFSAPKQALYYLKFKDENLNNGLKKLIATRKVEISYPNLPEILVETSDEQDIINIQLMNTVISLLKNDPKKAIRNILLAQNSINVSQPSDTIFSTYLYLKYLVANKYYFVVDANEFENDFKLISKNLKYFLLYEIVISENRNFQKISENKYDQLLKLAQDVSPYDYIKSLSTIFAKNKSNDIQKSLNLRDSLIDHIILKKYKKCCNDQVYYSTFKNDAEFEEQIKLEKIISLNDLGCYNRKTNQIETSIKNFETALQIQKNAKIKKLEAELFLNLGLTYSVKKEFERAEKYYFLAQKIFEEASNKSKIAETENFIAKNQFLNSQNKYSINTCNNSLNISLNNNDYKNASESYLVLSEIYSEENDFQESNKYYKLYSEYKKLFSDEQIKKSNQFSSIENQYENIAREARDQIQLEELKKAEYFKAKLETAKSERDLLEMKQQAQLNEAKLAYSKLDKEKANQALKLIEEKLRLKKIEITDLENRNKLNDLKTSYSQKQLELANNKNFLFLQSQIINELRVDIIRRNQRLLKLGIVSLVGLLLLVIIFLIIGIKNRRKIQVQNLNLSKKNEEIENQRNIIYHRNKEFVDSINYAVKIQSALLPNEEDMIDSLGNIYVYFKPKDIVSGDFYWYYETSEYFFYATADCTGHGVPGGFVSMLGISLLNEIVKDKKIEEPCDVLDLLSAKIVADLKQTDVKNASKDGMDISFCRLNKQKTELTYAGANNDLWLIRNNQIEVFKSDRQPVGFHFGELKQFNQHKIPLQKDDRIFTFTDGFADQFGGSKGKKFKSNNLKNLFISTYSHPIVEQKHIVNLTFENWKGNLEQVDDILIIGLRV
jgi:serine phosphatase RsbU (regulator of sigma subunit)